MMVIETNAVFFHPKKTVQNVDREVNYQRHWVQKLFAEQKNHEEQKCNDLN